MNNQIIKTIKESTSVICGSIFISTFEPIGMLIGGFFYLCFFISVLYL